jgi:hypothetical protein
MSALSQVLLAGVALALGLALGIPLGWRATPAGHASPRLSAALLKRAAGLLPAADRPRYTEDWRGELAALTTRRGRARFTSQMLWGMPRLAFTLRRPLRAPVPEKTKRGRT